MAGGTLRRWWRITFWRWRRTYSGHLTKRVRSDLGRISWPVGVWFVNMPYKSNLEELPTDTEVLRARLEKWVLFDLGGFAGTEGGGGGFLAGSRFGFRLVMETRSELGGHIS